MKGIVAALLGFTLAGCAAATTSTHATTAAGPVAPWDDGTREAALAPTVPDAVADARIEEGQRALAEARATITGEPGFAPEVIHEARVEMARQALVEDNQGKERVDIAEELERELAALQTTDQTTKSRVRHARDHKKP